MNAINMGSIVDIGMFCYLVGEAYKSVVSDGKKKYTPFVVAIVGGFLGILSYFAGDPNMTNIPQALLAGMFAGLSATGTNQVFQKISDRNDKEETENANL